MRCPYPDHSTRPQSPKTCPRACSKGSGLFLSDLVWWKARNCDEFSGNNWLIKETECLGYLAYSLGNLVQGILLKIGFEIFGSSWAILECQARECSLRCFRVGLYDYFLGPIFFWAKRENRAAEREVGKGSEFLICFWCDLARFGSGESLFSRERGRGEELNSRVFYKKQR